MRILLSLSAVALVSSSSIKAEASVNGCASELLAHVGPRCTLKKDLRLTRQQAREVNKIRRQSRRAAASLKLRLRRVRAALRDVRKVAISPMARRRLHQQQAWLTSQLERTQTRATAQVAAVLTKRQRRLCERTYLAAGHLRVKRMRRIYRGTFDPAGTLGSPYPRFTKATVRRAPYTPPTKVRRAPPSDTKKVRRAARARIVISYPPYVDRQASCRNPYGKSDC